jgi:hypothetical protein
VTKKRVRAKRFIKETTRYQGGYRERREFGFGSSSLAFNWIKQKALTRDSQSLVIKRRDKAKGF